jgi:acetyltransferase-like isoleucine patch superfamily enzyme
MDSPADSWKDKWKLDIFGHADMLALHQKLRQEMLEKWRRAVPFADELFDRWEQAAALGFGEESSIYNSSLVLGDVSVGNHTWVGPFTVLDGRGGLEIGHYCSISTGVQIYTHDTVKWALTGGKAAEERSPTRIGDCCYIGPLAVITRGVEIGDHSVVGAQSLVRESLPPFSIAVGTPARIIGRVELVGDSDVRFVYE